jgi:hypothetical protein
MPELYLKKQMLSDASSELEAMRSCKDAGDNDIFQHKRFPSACLNLLYSIDGNRRCVDCKASNPQWAAISFGALLCIDCSGRHRHLGVNVSVVRSVTMDSWSHSDVLAMLEGGNQQLDDFFCRHELSTSSAHSEEENTAIMLNRYRTNAAKFYRKNLTLHTSRVSCKGKYNGRDTYRQSRSNGQNNVRGTRQCKHQ